MALGLHFFLGFISSFLGTLTPSMLNMTAVKISLQKSKKEAIKYAIGVSVVVLIQAYIAILFTKYLRENPTFVASLQKIAAVIFIGLSIYFYTQSKKDKLPKKEVQQTAKNSFVIGVLLSGLNMFSIPFYCGVTTAFNVAGWLQFNQNNIMVFVLGSAIGTFTLLSLYARFATKIQTKSKGVTKNLNFILSLLTGILGVVTIVNSLLPKIW